MYVNALGIAPSNQQGSALNAGTAEIGFFLQQIDQGKSLAQVAGGFYLSNGSTQSVAEALIDIASSAQTGTDSYGKVIDQGSAGVFEAALATCQQGFLVEGADNRDRGENKWPSKPKPNLIPSLLRPRMRRARCLG